MPRGSIADIIEEMGRIIRTDDVIHQSRPNGHVGQHHCMVCHATWIPENQAEQYPLHAECVGRDMTRCDDRCDEYFQNNNPLNQNEQIERRSRPYFVIENELDGLRFETLVNGSDFLKESNNSKSKKFVPKTIGEVYQEALPKLVGLKSVEEVDKVMADYCDLRDDQLLRQILEESSHCHTAYELRCFIKEWIFRNK